MADPIPSPAPFRKRDSGRALWRDARGAVHSAEMAIVAFLALLLVFMAWKKLSGDEAEPTQITETAADATDAAGDEDTGGSAGGSGSEGAAADVAAPEELPDPTQVTPVTAQDEAQ